jgi:quercetin dioxygenase-like cupin family protein
MPFLHLDQTPHRIAGAANFQVINIAPVMMLRVTIPPRTHLPAHAHENFQMGYVLAGSGSLTIGDESARVSPGMAYTIPANILHDLRTEDEPLELLDIYYPPKEDRV